MLKELIEYIAKALVDNPDQVKSLRNRRGKDIGHRAQRGQGRSGKGHRQTGTDRPGYENNTERSLNQGEEEGSSRNHRIMKLHSGRADSCRPRVKRRGKIPVLQRKRHGFLAVSVIFR